MIEATTHRILLTHAVHAYARAVVVVRAYRLLGAAARGNRWVADDDDDATARRMNTCARATD